MTYRPPERLATHHRLDRFDCGEPELDEWLKTYALQGPASTFVTTLDDGESVVGYYALVAAEVRPESATSRARKGQPTKRPVPAALMARLAVDRQHQGAGVGRSLLVDALQRAVAAADSIGWRVFLVHALHEQARGWYAQYGFETSPTDPLHLMMLLKDVKKVLRGVELTRDLTAAERKAYLADG